LPKTHTTHNQQSVDIFKPSQTVLKALKKTDRMERGKTYNTTLPRPARPPHAMRIALDIRGHVEVDDQRHVRDVDAAACEVGGDEDFAFALAHAGEGFFALDLRLAAVQDLGVEAVLFDVAGDGVGVSLGVRKLVENFGL